MKKSFLSVTVIVMINFAAIAQTYYPQGDPHKWQVEVTPYVWLPWIKGTVGVDGLIKDVEGNINATPTDLVNNLKSAFLLKADVIKSDFIGFADYMYLKLESEKKQVQLPRGSYVYFLPKIKTDVLEIAAGGRVHFNKGMVDPFFGTRYFSLNNSLELSDSASTKTGSQAISYWDPMFGARLFYYPKERLMLFLRSDIGGIWGGNAGFSFNAEGKVGYTISPTVDIAGGFRYWSFKYSESSSDGKRIFYMNPSMYGFEISATFMIPRALP